MQAAALADRRDLHVLAERGFAPTRPTTSTGARAKVRARGPDEAPQRRRVNVLGAWAPLGRRPRFVSTSRAGTLDRAAVLEVVWQAVGGMTTPLGEVPTGVRRARRCVIVLDTDAVHRSQAGTDARPGLVAAGLERVSLPPYSPALNLIEGRWRHVTHEALPIRSDPTVQAVQAAVDQALDQHVALPTQCADELPEAA